MSRFLTIILICLSCAATGSDLNSQSLPADAAIYLHVNIDGMRTYPAGAPLFKWFTDEVLDEIEKETGLTPGAELDSLTLVVYDRGVGSVLLRGPLSDDARSQLVQHARDNGAVEYGQASETYVLENNGRFGRSDVDRLYLSLSNPELLVVTTREDDLLEVLAGGELLSAEEPGDSLVVLRADRSLIQGGMRNSDSFSRQWDSSVMRNMEEAALVIADDGGALSVEAQVRATTSAIAASMQAIVEGVLALKHLAIEDEPELAALLENVQVASNGDLLSIRTVVESDALVELLD